MTDKNDNKLFENSNDLFERNDLIETMKKSIIDSFTKIMDEEVEKLTGSEKGKHSNDRNTSLNGTRKRSLDTQIGELILSIPKIRDGSYYPSFLEYGCRIHSSLVNFVCDSYVLGISTRKVDALAKSLGISKISKSTVSNIVKKLDDDIAVFRKRTLPKCAYVSVDATYIHVMEDGNVINKALFIATGVDESGTRVMLDFCVKNAENDVNWYDFFDGLKNRGLDGVKLIVSDCHASIRKAAGSVYPESSWQRCVVHLQRNLVANISAKKRNKVLAFFSLILESNGFEEAKKETENVINIFHRDYPEAGKVLENADMTFLTYYNFPKEHHKRIYTTNLIERFNREIKRRTNSVSIFPNVSSLERLAGAIIINQNNKWQSQPTKYLDMSLLTDEKEEARKELEVEGSNNKG